MITNIDKLTQDGCGAEKKDKVCRSRGGESCAFDGAMIVLQPVADTAHIVHGSIACCGNSWEGRGSLSRVGASKGEESSSLHKMGFTTDLNEMDIVYGAEEKLYQAILQTCSAVRPKAVFVYATCVSGLTGEDIEAVCKKAETEAGVRVIPVNAPGFTGPKNLGNRIAGQVLLDHVIGTGEPPFVTEYDINLIGEYNIAGDLWLLEPVLNKAGIRILSRVTGDATFEELTWAHRAKLNVVVCSRALINVAREMERRYGIPYAEVSFFGKTEMSKALRAIKDRLNGSNGSNGSNGFNGFNGSNSSNAFSERIEAVISAEEERLEERLKAYEHLRGKKAVLYTGGVKSWSFISALLDLGIEVVAVGTKKSTFEDEEKMKTILGPDAPLVEDVTPKNLLRLFRDKGADMLIAGGRNQYLAVKEGIPFVDVNQERHTAYAGYDGLVNLAEDISNSMKFYGGTGDPGLGISKRTVDSKQAGRRPDINACSLTPALVINPLKHSQVLGAAMAFQGIHSAAPVIHGAQGCNFLGKVLLTKHFREPISLVSTKLFTEDVVMGSEERIAGTIGNIIGKNGPDVIGLLTTGLSEVKGDDISDVVKELRLKHPETRFLHVSTPDYEGGLESGYAKAVEAMIGIAGSGLRSSPSPFPVPVGGGQINVLTGSHLTPADFTELREIVESFGLRALILPDLSALDGSRQGFSPLAVGGTPVADIEKMATSVFTIAVGTSMEKAAMKLKERFGIEYRVFEGIAGLEDTDALMQTLAALSVREMPDRYKRQRRILIDGMRDAHLLYGKKKVCLALEPDLSVQFSKWLGEMGASVALAVLPQHADSAARVRAVETVVGDLFSIEGDFDILISGSHAVDTAERLETALYQAGFPVYKIFGNTAKVTIGYRGTLTTINEVANVFVKGLRKNKLRNWRSNLQQIQLI
jgi:nitrogenase molybdenum-cofactor synthesis protein NifE